MVPLVMTHASDADVERSLLEAGSYWSTMQHLLAIMSGRKSSMSVLHWLPGELLTNIARLAIRQARLVWAPLPDSPDLEVGYWRRGTTIALMPGPSTSVNPSLWLPTRRQVYYVELALDDAWCGSTIRCHLASLAFDVAEEDVTYCGRASCPSGEEQIMAANSWRNVACNAFLERTLNRRPGPLACTCSSAGTCSTFVVGMLCHLEEGWVAWRLNGHNGLKCHLGEGWEAGVKISMDDEFGDFTFDDPPWMASIMQPSKVPAGLYDVPFAESLGSQGGFIGDGIEEEGESDGADE